MKIGDIVRVSWQPLDSRLGTIVSIRHSVSYEVEFESNITINHEVNDAYEAQRSNPIYDFKGKLQQSLFFSIDYLQVVYIPSLEQLSGKVSDIFSSRVFRLDGRLCVLRPDYKVKLKVNDIVTIKYLIRNNVYEVYNITINY